MVPPPRLFTQTSSLSPDSDSPHSSTSKSSTTQRANDQPSRSTSPHSHLLAPATINISPPSPIDPKVSPFHSTPPRSPLSQEEVQYDSPDEEDGSDDDDDQSGNLLDVSPKIRRRSSATPKKPIASDSFSLSPSRESSLLAPDLDSPDAQNITRTLSNTSISQHFSPLVRTPSPSSPHYRPKALHHRRLSSTHRVKESQGQTRSTEDGGRMVNQYKIGKSLGQGAYAKVELAVNAQTGEEFAIKEFSKSRLHYQSLQDKHRQEARNRIRRVRSRTPNKPGPRVDSEHDDEGSDRDDTRRKSNAYGQGETDTEGKMSGPWGSTKTVSEDPLGLIRREIAIMKKLDHPNLVHLYEAISVPHEDSLFLVLEYLSGGVLMEVHLGEERPPPFNMNQTREYFRQLCLGLEYLHFNGVIHRDIKPDNILLSKDREIVKLCDFGVSEMFVAAGDDTVKKSGGSPAFLSPESFVSHRHEVHGKAVDIWALGVTLYCMLSGQLPFNLANPMELFEVVKSKDPEYPSEWDTSLIDMLKRMFMKDPQKRIKLADIREHPWVTDNGDEPMISTEDNLYHVGKQVEEPTQEELSNAVSHLRNAFTVARAVQKFRSGLRRARSNNPNLPSSPSTQPGSFDSYATMNTEFSDTTTTTSLDDERGDGKYRDFMGEQVMSPGLMPNDDSETLGLERFRLDSVAKDEEERKPELGKIQTDTETDDVQMVDSPTGGDDEGVQMMESPISDKDEESKAPPAIQTDIQTDQKDFQVVDSPIFDDELPSKRGALDRIQTDTQEHYEQQREDGNDDDVQIMQSPVSDEELSTPISRRV